MSEIYSIPDKKKNPAFIPLSCFKLPPHVMTTVIIQDHKMRVNFVCQCNGLSSKILVIVLFLLHRLLALVQTAKVVKYSYMALMIQTVAYFQF